MIKGKMKKNDASKATMAKTIDRQQKVVVEASVIIGRYADCINAHHRALVALDKLLDKPLGDKQRFLLQREVRLLHNKASIILNLPEDECYHGPDQDETESILPEGGEAGGRTS